MSWTDEGQVKSVERRQARLQERVDAASEQAVEEPRTLQAAGALAAMPAEERNRPDTFPPRQHYQRNYVEENKAWFEEVRKKRLAIHDGLVEIARDGIERIQQRLTRGDPIINATGAVIGYRPPRLRDLDSVVGMAIDRQIDLEKRILGENDNGTGPPNRNVEALLVRLELVSRETPITGEVRGEFREPKVLNVGDDA